MAQFVEYFDIWGNSFNPTVSYSSKQNTVIGGLAGMIYFGMFIYVSYSFGSDLIDRKQPTLIAVTDVDGENQFDFVMSFGFKFYIKEKYNPNITADQRKKDMDFLNIKANLDQIVTVQSSYFDASIEKTISIGNCSDPNFNLTFIQQNIELTALDKEMINQARCINSNEFEMFLYKRNGDARAKTIEITMYICKNASHIEQKCLPQETIDYYFNNYELRPFYIYAGVIFDPGNYQVPYSFFLDNFYSKPIVSPIFTKVTHYLDIQTRDLTTDDGLFYPVQTNNTAQSIEKQSYLIGGDPYVKSKDGVTRLAFNQIVFSASKNTIKYTRTYIRLQDVIANVGGVLTIIAFLFQYLLQNVYDSMTKELIIQQIFKINEKTIINGSLIKKANTKSTYSKQVSDEEKEKELKGNDKTQTPERNQALEQKNIFTAQINQPLSQIALENANTNNNRLKEDNKLIENNKLYYSKEKGDQLEVSPDGINIELRDFEDMNIEEDKPENKIENFPVGKQLQSDKQLTQPINAEEKTLNIRTSNNNLNNLSQDLSRDMLNNGDFYEKNIFSQDERSPKNKVGGFNDMSFLDLKIKSGTTKTHRGEYKSIALENVEESRVKNATRELPISKDKYNCTKVEDSLLSFFDHMVIVYCPCLLCGKAKRAKEYYDQVEDIIVYYTDILSICNNIFEMEKLKFLMFNEDQTSIFNLRTSKVEVEEESINSSDFSKFFYFIKDLDDNVKTDLIRESLSNDVDNPLNRKLVQLSKSS